VEKDMIAAIDLVFQHYPEAKGRFCLLPAIENEKLRKLEMAICQGIATSTPHVYACSSYKEEFGISLLEAMDAGMLVFGPLQGGVNSYIRSGENGFLMDTSSVEEMKKAFHHSLRLTAQDELFAIARRGQETVREQYDIQTSARQFARMYLDIA
jgi:glycosyltransferase involved in cell wall biosynthesis